MQDERRVVVGVERLAYSVDEVARLTGLSRDLLYDEMRRGNLPYTKVGRRRIITRQHLDQFLSPTPERRFPVELLQLVSTAFHGQVTNREMDIG